MISDVVFISAAHRGLDLKHRIDTLWSTYLTVIMEAHKTGFVQQGEHGIRHMERSFPRYTAHNGRLCQKPERSIAVFEKVVHNWRGFVSEGPCFLVISLMRCAHETHYDRSDDKE